MGYITTKKRFYPLTQDVHRRLEQETPSILNIYKKDSQPMPKQARGCCHRKWKPKGKITFFALSQFKEVILIFSMSCIIVFNLFENSLLFLSVLCITKSAAKTYVGVCNLPRSYQTGESDP